MCGRMKRDAQRLDHGIPAPELPPPQRSLALGGGTAKTRGDQVRRSRGHGDGRWAFSAGQSVPSSRESETATVDFNAVGRCHVRVPSWVETEQDSGEESVERCQNTVGGFE